jgi:hypothetical protein
MTHLTNIDYLLMLVYFAVVLAGAQRIGPFTVQRASAPRSGSTRLDWSASRPTLPRSTAL